MSSAAACATPAARAGFTKRCAICGRTYEAETWNALPVVATLPPASVQTHLTVTTAWGIELRSCGCGAVLATRR